MQAGLEQYALACLDARYWYVGYSGGLDSTVLLHALAEMLARQTGKNLPRLVAVHINHHLQIEADTWQQHCVMQTQQWGIALECHSVDIPPGGNLEANARQARFAVFEPLLQTDDCLFLAHHQDDQAETLLYRLIRGSGVTGLGAIKAVRPLGQGRLVRPLLQSTRASLRSYADKNRLRYIEDPSNDDQTFDRNYLRHSILPLLRKRWPRAVANISRSIAHQQQADELLAELAAQDYRGWQGMDGLEPWLDSKAFASLSPARQDNALRYWLHTQDCKISEKQLKTLFDQVMYADDQAMPQLQLGDKILRRFSGRLYLCQKDQPQVFADFIWQGTAPFCIAGLAFFQFSEPCDKTFEVCCRKGGERIRLVGSTHHRSLKDLLREAGIPPWRRALLPLLYYQGELIAVADLFVSDNAAAVLGNNKLISAGPDTLARANP